MRGLFSILAAGALVLGSGSAALAQSAPQPDCSTSSGNLVQDCGFEAPALAAGVPSQFFSGEAGQAFPSPPVWQAQSQGADGAFRSGGATLFNNAANGGWNANSGQQSLLLQGVGGVRQAITTQQGKLYGISFAAANSPSGCLAAENVASLTWGASPSVGAPDTQTAFFTTVSNEFAPPNSVTWHQVTFGAFSGAPKGKTSYLSFYGQPGLGGSGTGCGSVVIDDVVVVECTPGAAKKNGCQ